MSQIKSVSEWMKEREMDVVELIAASAVDEHVVKAIVLGRYTPSPEQRRRIAAALGVDVEHIAWGHTTPIQHVYGHGPQFGRSP